MPVECVTRNKYHFNNNNNTNGNYSKKKKRNARFFIFFFICLPLAKEGRNINSNNKNNNNNNNKKKKLINEMLLFLCHAFAFVCFTVNEPECMKASKASLCKCVSKVNTSEYVPLCVDESVNKNFIFGLSFGK